jgi:hypothetical protein
VESGSDDGLRLDQLGMRIKRPFSSLQTTTTDNSPKGVGTLAVLSVSLNQQTVFYLLASRTQDFAPDEHPSGKQRNEWSRYDSSHGMRCRRSSIFQVQQTRKLIHADRANR